MKDYTEAGKRVETAQGVGTVLFYTDGYAGELDYYLVALDVPAEYGVSQVYVAPGEVTEEPEPKKIRFAGKQCQRCEGYGRSGNWSGNKQCYSCGGGGFKLSEEGRQARKAYGQAIRDTFRAPFGSLKVGDKFAILGSDKWLHIETERDLKALPAEEVVTIDVPGAHAQIMRDIAAQYPGASLVY